MIDYNPHEWCYEKIDDMNNQIDILKQEVESLEIENKDLILKMERYKYIIDVITKIAELESLRIMNLCNQTVEILG